MLIIGGIILLLAGALMICNPNAVFQITQGWKSYSASEPSKLYIISTRIGGAAFAIAGLLGIITFFIN